MKLRNRTHWRTDHLKAIVARIANEELGDRPQALKLLTVDIEYTRVSRHRKRSDQLGAEPRTGQTDWSSYSSGCASIGGFWMCVRIARENPDKIDFAHVVAHELGHVRGYRHRDMRGWSKYNRIGNWRELYAWAVDYPLERFPIKPKPTREESRSLKSVQRQQSAVRTLEKWSRKLKLAKTKVKTWTRKVRYYEKRAAQKPGASE